MAELYLGESVSGDVQRRVVLKRLLPEHADDPLRVSMFLEEARVAATLQHPHVVQTLDVVSGQHPVLVLEYLDGTDLQRFRRRLGDDRRMPLEHALLVARGVLAALAYAHDRHVEDGGYPIVHQDVSPQNIFVTRDGGIKLLDFGVARHGEEPSDVLAGKVLYMAPEQCGQGEIDARTDVYALGVVLFQLVTGNVPFRSTDTWQTMRAIIEKPTPRPRHLNPDLPARLDDVIVMALEKDPANRWNSAHELLEALDDVSRAEGIFQSELAFARFVQECLGPRLAAASPDAPGDLELAPVTIEALPVRLEGLGRLQMSLADAIPEPELVAGRLEALASAATHMQLVAAPVGLATAVSSSTPLRSVMRVESVSVATHCSDCGHASTTSLPMDRVRAAAPLQRISQPCERCGGSVKVSTSLEDLRKAASSPPTTVHNAPGCLSRFGFSS